MTRIILTFGTFDLFHVGHLNLLYRASKLGDRLIVGVSSDKFSAAKKGRPPVFSEQDRQAIVQSLRWVSSIFLEESMEQKRDYILRYNADVLVMGDDWKGHFDDFADICQVVYLPRTTGVSTTEIIESIRKI